MNHLGCKGLFSPGIRSFLLTWIRQKRLLSWVKWREHIYSCCSFPFSGATKDKSKCNRIYPNPHEVFFFAPFLVCLRKHWRFYFPISNLTWRCCRIIMFPFQETMISFNPTSVQLQMVYDFYLFGKQRSFLLYSCEVGEKIPMVCKFCIYLLRDTRSFCSFSIIGPI